jgi:hypothetical protein
MKLSYKVGSVLAALALVFFGMLGTPVQASVNAPQAKVAAVQQITPNKAQALTLWHNCPSDYICLYQWTGYGAPPGDANPGWKSSFYNLRSQICINLTDPAAYWPNGTKVWDNSAALIVGGSGAYGQSDSISFYNSLNCNSNTGVTSLNANWVTGYSDLHTVPMGYGYTAYHTIASIGWRENCPPSGC